MACPNRGGGGVGRKRIAIHVYVQYQKINTETRYYSHNYITVCKNVTIIWKKVKNQLL